MERIACSYNCELIAYHYSAIKMILQSSFCVSQKQKKSFSCQTLSSPDNLLLSFKPVPHAECLLSTLLHG